jgi:hypothetical protein
MEKLLLIAGNQLIVVTVSSNAPNNIEQHEDFVRMQDKINRS